jgi:transposase
MSMKPEEIEPIPEETMQLARVVCPQDNLCLLLSDELGEVFQDALFASLFPRRGQPAESPWRLAMVTVLQFAEGLSDRQAANAVRTRIDWKYALHLHLDDVGFHFSVLSEFRTRLVTAGAERDLFDALLRHAKTRGWLKMRGSQRTDSTHVLAAIQTLSRLECVGETLRHALNILATIAPEWLQERVPLEWYERYATRWEDYRLPSGRQEREELAAMIGRDGRSLLTLIDAEASPTWLREIPAILTLRRVWMQQFYAHEHDAMWRKAMDLPASSLLICTPYDPDARFSKKRATTWTGYKVHVTESCDEDTPHLITDVQTTPATTSDFEMAPRIHALLAQHEILPEEHFVDAGYVTTSHLITSQAQYGIHLIGPVAPDNSWQAQAGTGFELANFAIDWQTKTASCPQGCQSCLWMDRQDRHQQAVAHIKFAKQDCLACPVRAQCTHSTTEPRGLMIRADQAYQVLQAARQRQKTPEFKDLYATRAGIEGTLSQEVRTFGARRCRYVGEAKAHLQQLMTAVAVNVVRLAAWTTEQPRGQTRQSRFAALAPAS